MAGANRTPHQDTSFQDTRQEKIPARDPLAHSDAPLAPDYAIHREDLGIAASPNAPPNATGSLDARHYERLLATSASLAGAPDLQTFAQTLLAAGLEFADAARAVLVVDLDSAWSVVASAQRSPPAFQAHSATPLASAQESRQLQVDPVLHAIRTRRTHFQPANPNTAPSQPGIFCAPLLYAGQVMAILYLEKPGAPYTELAVQMVARITQQAAPRLHTLQEMERLAELVQLRREMTEALRASEERFRSIFNSSPVMIFLTDSAGRLIMVNDYWLHALGYTRVEAVSRPIGDFSTPTGQMLLAQQLHPTVEPGHQYENLPVQFVRRNGALLDALVSGVILHSEVEGFSQCLSFAIDMTAHRQAEQELDRYRRRLEELVRERTHELSAANRQLEQDILRRKAAEAQLLRSQQFLQATIDALSEKLAILDAQGAIVALNSSWRTQPGPSGYERGAQPARAYSPAELAYWQGYQVGADYLTALKGISPPADADTTATDATRPVDDDVVQAVERGLDALQRGTQNFFQVVYQLHTPEDLVHGPATAEQTASPAQDAPVAPEIGHAPAANQAPANDQPPQNWYSLRAMRFQSGGETYIAVAHDDVSDRKRAEQALLEAAAVNERHRLARELHDSVTQALYSMALFVDATRLALDAGQVTRASDNLLELRGMSRGAMEYMRALIFELHPPELAEIGLVGALREYLKNYQHRTQISVDFQINGEERAYPVRTESEIYRVAQEALNNCFKHARADHVAVTLRYDNGGLDLTITDNGQGFQTELAHLSGGMGLRGMRERMRSIGGRIAVESRPSHGATIRVSMQ